MKNIYLTFLTFLLVASVNAQQMALDIDPNNSSDPVAFSNIGGDFYVTASVNGDNELLKITNNGGVYTSELISVNGTSGSSNPGKKVVANNKLYFPAIAANGYSSLFEYNGTNLIDHTPGFADKRNPQNLIVVNGKIYFSGTLSATQSRRYLYVFDESANPKVSLINISGMPSIPSTSLSFAPSNFVSVGNILYFTATHDSGNIRLFYLNSTDGTSGHINNNSLADANFLFAYGSDIYLRGKLNGSTTDEFLKVDTQNGNVISVLPNNPQVPINSTFTGHANVLYYKTNFNGSNEGLGIYNLNTNTFSFKNTAPNNSQIDYITKYNGKIYFSSFFPGSDKELAEYNPNTDVITQIEVNNGALGSSPSWLYVFENKLFFGAAGGNGAGRELWVYDFNALSVNDVVLKNISIYPNPVKESFLLTAKDQISIDRVDLINIHGQLVKSFSRIPNVYDIVELSQGVYFVNIETDRGNSTIKIIKE